MVVGPHDALSCHFYRDESARDIRIQNRNRCYALGTGAPDRALRDMVDVRPVARLAEYP